ncbi:MAG TPA: MFS transporter [Frankiaceae bacterium]|nr:MFS transporter [Frankiaceae bacterium]
MGVAGRMSGSVGKVRRMARRGGAEESGFAAMQELVFVSSAGDALIAVALAGSQFLSVQPGEARNKVALYLLITMAPFALLAPLVGPMLDRFPNGRRIALGVTLLARAALAYSLAGYISGSGLLLYPLALGLLMLSKAFGVARSAVVPRVVPESMTLVKANSRLTLTTVLAGLVIAPLGYGIANAVGYDWLLRMAAVIFGIGLFFAWVLPHHVDSAAGEQRAAALARATVVGGSRVRRVLGELPAALRSAVSVRALVGFLTIFLAFYFREHGGGLKEIGLLGLAASVGSGVGVFLGGRFKQGKPEVLILFALILAGAGCVGAALLSTQAIALGATFCACLAGSMGKLGLDAVIQRDVAEDTRNSAFATSETAMQLCWVLGGAVGLIPMPALAAFSIGATGMTVALIAESVSLRRVRRRARAMRTTSATAPSPTSSAG